MSGAVSRRGLWRGLESRPFAAADLLAAADQAHAATGSVLVDVDAEGFLRARGGGAAVAARARLAERAAECDAEVCAAEQRGSAGGWARGSALRVRLVRAVPPLHDVRVWPHADLLARLRLPAPPLLAGPGGYECAECGARFAEPYPLTAHLFLRCAPSSPQRFWRHLALALALSAAPEPAPPAWARLEALAAAWGRGRGGHACLYCGKLYSRKYGLKIHIRTHTGYRPLRCRHCARAFGDPSNLNKHVRLHAAGAPRRLAPSRAAPALQ